MGQLGIWKDRWERGSGQSGCVLRLQGSGPTDVFDTTLWAGFEPTLLWFRLLFSTHYTTGSSFITLGNNIYILLKWHQLNELSIGLSEIWTRGTVFGSRLDGTHAYPLNHRGFLQGYLLQDGLIALMTLLNAKGQHIFCFCQCQVIKPSYHTYKQVKVCWRIYKNSFTKYSDDKLTFLEYT